MVQRPTENGTMAGVFFIYSDFFGVTNKPRPAVPHGQKGALTAIPTQLPSN